MHSIFIYAYMQFSSLLFLFSPLICWTRHELSKWEHKFSRDYFISRQDFVFIYPKRALWKAAERKKKKERKTPPNIGIIKKNEMIERAQRNKHWILLLALKTTKKKKKEILLSVSSSRNIPLKWNEMSMNWVFNFDACVQ